jgi:hypothetical protein
VNIAKLHQAKNVVLLIVGNQMAGNASHTGHVGPD